MQENKHDSATKQIAGPKLKSLHTPSSRKFAQMPEISLITPLRLKKIPKFINDFSSRS